MDDFDKHIKNHLESKPLPAFLESDWDAMHTKLDQASSSHTMSWMRYWWLPLLFLLLGSQVWLFQQWNTVSKQLKASKQNSSNGRLIIQTDTVYQSQIIYRTDTIYLGSTTTVRKNSLPFSTENQKPSPSYRTAGQTFYASTWLRNHSLKISKNSIIEKGASRLSPTSQQQFMAIAGNSTIQFTNTHVANSMGIGHTLKSGAMEYLPGLTIQKLGHPVQISARTHRLAAPPVTNHFLKAKKGPFDDFRLQGISMEGGLGYHTLTNEYLSYRNDVGLQLGVLLQFSRSLELWLDATYTNMSFETGQIDERLNLPLVAPPTSDLDFVAVEAIRPSLLTSLGAMYTHPTGTRLRPQIGVGFSNSSIFDYDIIYEFRNQSNGNEWNAEKSVPMAFHFANHAILKAGAKYALTDYWRAYFRASYYHNIRSGIHPDMYIIQVGLSFDF
jgi:hypothetical protein